MLLPLLSDPDIADAEQGAALDAIRDALQRSSFELHPIPPATMQGLLGCDTEECAAEARRVASDAGPAEAGDSSPADAGASDAAGDAVVTLFPEPRGSYSGRATPDPDDDEALLTAARAALHDAQQRRAGGPGAVLSVRGTPEGADVELDGAYAGRLPYRNAISAGDHQLLVRRDGYLEERRTFHIPDTPGHIQRVGVELRRVAEAASGGMQTPGIALSIAGGAVLLLGAGMLIGSAAQASATLYAPDDGLFAAWSLVAGTGLVVGIVGLVLLLSDDRGSSGRANLGTWSIDLGRL